MTSTEQELLTAIELHSVEQLRGLLEGGLDPHSPVRGKLPVTWMTEMYTRSDRFAACLRLLLEAGASTDAAITWGEGFEWETTCFDVTPISYAQPGLLPQMHRRVTEVP